MRIENGKYLVGASNPRWNLFDHSLNARFRDRINFSQSFQNLPKLIIAISGFDIRGDYDKSVSVHAERITENGFDIHISTNSGKVWELTVDWMAIGT